MLPKLISVSILILSLGLGLGLSLSLSGCVSNYDRLPSSAAQVYSNSDVQQSLLLAAQNNLMVNIPEETTREFEKTEVDSKCHLIHEPLWAEKLSVYLNEFRKRPELLNRLHIIEMKRGDSADVKIQKDLDGAVTLSIQFVKFESHGKIGFQTKLPCKASVAEYMGRELIKTDYDFPDMEKFVLALQGLPERKELPRFQFSNQFLIFLAERGALFKFTHELSFEKTSQGKFVMVELMNKLSDEVKQPAHQHVNYWMKQINSESTQAQLIQLFALVEDKDLKVGVRVDLKNEATSKVVGEADLTYLYLTYNVQSDQVQSANLQQLEKCLQGFTDNMSGIRLRKPAANEKESYLRPGYSCAVNSL